MSFAGYVPVAGIAYNALTTTIQSDISDNVHGPAGTTVTGTSPGVMTITVTSNAVLTANLSGLTGGLPTLAISNGATLVGCSSSGLTTNTDTSQRYSDWITDSFGAPILWVANYGGLYVNDNLSFRYGGVSTDPNYDIIIGFANDTSRNTGSAIYLGADNFSGGAAVNTASISRGNDGFGNPQILFKTHGTSGSPIFTLDAVAFYPSTSAQALGTSGNYWGAIYSQAVHSQNSTVTTPAYTSSGDINSGIFFPGRAQVALSVTGPGQIVSWSATGGAYSKPLTVGAGLNLGSSLATQTIATNGSTVDTAGITYQQVTSAASYTGLILQAGTSDGQVMVVTNVGSWPSRGQSSPDIADRLP